MLSNSLTWLISSKSVSPMTLSPQQLEKEVDVVEGAAEGARCCKLLEDEGWKEEILVEEEELQQLWLVAVEDVVVVEAGGATSCCCKRRGLGFQ